MLTGLRLGNFKAFADTQQVPIRPLTLIFGANSAGKSSIIHSLLLARHAFETGELDAHRTTVGGDSVDLGGFHQYIHQRDAGRRMEWSAEIDVARLQGRMAELLAPIQLVTVTLTAGIKLDNQGRPMQGAEPEVSSYEIEADGVSLLRMSHRPDGVLQLDRLEQEHPVLRGVLKAIVETSTTAESLQPSDFEGLNQAIAGLVPEIVARSEGFLPRGLSRFGVREYVGQGKVEVRQFLQRELFEKSQSETLLGGAEQPMLFPVSRGRRQEDLAAAVRFFLPRTLDEIMKGLREAVGSELSRLQYLGPLRSYPPRHLAFAQHHDPNWFAGGGYAWDVVRRNKSVRDAVNRWLNSPERLQTPYELMVRQLVGINEIESPIAEKLQKASDFVESEGRIPMFDDPEAGAREFIEAISSSDIEKINELILFDHRSKTVVSHRDVGIGISQVLPVLVSAFASSGKILAMEQPEIHLHPALQAELADVFIESALGERKNTFFLETHSEHLMLRVLRRIRETADGELAAGLTPIRPEQVAVLYVLPDTQGAKVVEIPIRTDGEFAEKWPQGFFAERAKELF